MAQAVESPNCAPSQHFVAPGAPLQFDVGEGRLLSAWQGEVLHASNSDLIAPQDGISFLAVASVDRDGIRSEVCWHQIIVDTQPPEVTAVFDPLSVQDNQGKSWLKPGAELVVHTADLVSGDPHVQLLSGGTVLAEGTTTLRRTLPATGKMDLELVAHDRVGNQARLRLDPVEIDAIQPTLSWAWNGYSEQRPEGWVVGPNTTLNLVANDDQSGLRDRDTAPEDPPWSFTDGPAEQSFAITRMDRVDNQATLETGPILVDRIPPRVSSTILGDWVAGEDGDRFYAEPVSIEVAAIDNLSGTVSVQFLDDDGSWKTVVDLVEGVNQSAQIQARDAAGNQSSHRVRWRTDRTPPELNMLCNEQLVSVEARIVTGSACQVGVTDPGGVGVERWSWSRTGINVPHTEPRIRLPNRGRFHIVANAVDRLGNQTVKDWILIVEAP